MSNLFFYKFLGVLSWPLYRFFPAGYFSLYSFYKQSSESYKLSLLPRYIKPGDTILDIGAHVGFFSREFALLAGEQGKVFAFEPDPRNFQHLQRNSRILKQVQVFRLAVAASTGEGRLFRSKILNVDHRLYGQGPGYERVATMSVDDFVKQQGLVPNFIKLDIQGYEFEAMLGMRQTLTVHRPAIMTEFWPWGLLAAGSSPEAYLGLWESLGYKVFLVNEKKRKLERLLFLSLPRGQADYYDLLCYV